MVNAIERLRKVERQQVHKADWNVEGLSCHWCTWLKWCTSDVLAQVMYWLTVELQHPGHNVLIKAGDNKMDTDKAYWHIPEVLRSFKILHKLAMQA